MQEYSIALVTDSTCDIPDELVVQYGIEVVPSLVIWGKEELRDRVDLQPVDFYRRLAEDPVFPTTACPTPEAFGEVYQRLVAKGFKEIVVITISSGMSGTIRSAQQAVSMVDVPVHVFDSMGPTMTVGWQVLAAARVRESGGNVEAMLAAAKQAQSRMVQMVCLDTLEYLHKGGRIGSATAFIGSLLHIKPLVVINHETGLVEGGKRGRTRKKALELLYREFFGLLDTAKTLRVAVLHGDCLAEAERIAERIQREFAPAELLINITGPVLGVHTGPRAIALCGYTQG